MTTERDLNAIKAALKPELAALGWFMYGRGINGVPPSEELRVYGHDLTGNGEKDTGVLMPALTPHFKALGWILTHVRAQVGADGTRVLLATAKPLWKAVGVVSQPAVMPGSFFITTGVPKPASQVFVYNVYTGSEALKLTSKCECGAHKVSGIGRGPGHSSWCPWSKS